MSKGLDGRMAVIDRYFLAHPRSIGEGYFEHMRVAAWFGATMLCGAAACFVHALVPALCPRTASRLIEVMHRRAAARVPGPKARSRLSAMGSD